jgi:Protein of unknown function DUF262
MLTKAENRHMVSSESLEEHTGETPSQLELLGEEDGVEEIDEGDGEIKRPYDPAKTHIITRQQSVDSLAKRIQFDEIDMAPEFQRGAGLWSNERMSRLVESMLIRIPLPAFYFDGSNDERWLVVDGLQRLITFQLFLVGKSLRLSKLEYLQEYEGYAFDALPRDLRRRIEETQVTLHIIQAGTPPEVKFNIFRRINTGGLMLNGQEIRHALNQGAATRFLEDLARLPAFTQATARSVSPRRMLDREMVLRFLAFTLTPYSQYDEDNLETFLNRHMGALNKLSEKELEDLEVRFERAMHAARDIFGPAAFRKQDRRQPNRRNPINKPLFEAWSAVLGGCSPEDLERLVHRRDALARRMEYACVDDRDFLSAISQATNNVVSVRRRFSTIEKMVAATLAGEPAP